MATAVDSGRALVANKAATNDQIIAAIKAVIAEKRPWYNAASKAIFGDKFEQWDKAVAQTEFFLSGGGDKSLAEKRAKNPKVTEALKKMLTAVINDENYNPGFLGGIKEVAGLATGNAKKFVQEDVIDPAYKKLKELKDETVDQVKGAIPTVAIGLGAAVLAVVWVYGRARR